MVVWDDFKSVIFRGQKQNLSAPISENIDILTVI